ncbi:MULTISPECIES: hypothetical protein [unclassified Pseudomonas]|uniref:hypothetical protein n=1 Tax=unclassified Pseudomonas TaxID=196821 RepID=UPI002115A9C3|nr:MULTISPECIES: hypothetical protein [unclassified Pseudomonas]
MKTRIALSLLLMLSAPLAGATSFSQATASLLSTLSGLGASAVPGMQAPAQTKAAVAAPKSKPAAPNVKKVASKTSSRKKADTVANELPKPKLDLSLPKDMVDALKPEPKGPATVVKAPNRLPAMFNTKPAGQEDFELNGRLISNEMDLNLRNEARRDVEGAALDFKFRQ